MNTHAKLTLLFSITGLVAGCGGGGDSGTANPPATTTGTFVDSATQGIAYTCGATTGVTDAMGTLISSRATAARSRLAASHWALLRASHSSRRSTLLLARQARRTPWSRTSRSS